MQDARQSEGYHVREGSYLATGCCYLPNVIKVGVTRWAVAHPRGGCPAQLSAAQLECSAGLHLAGAGARLGFSHAASTANTIL